MSESNYIRTLESAHRGELLDMVDKELSEVIAAIRRHGGTGKVTTDLTITAIGEGRVTVTGKVNAKRPRPTLPSSMFYTNEANALQRNDPRQAALFVESDERDA